MGSLSSSAKAPPRPQVAYVPTPTATTTAIANEPVQEDTAKESEEREGNLLRRARGRLGTVATSLHGFLSEGEKNTSRKTLLGE